MISLRSFLEVSCRNHFLILQALTSVLIPYDGHTFSMKAGNSSLHCPSTPSPYESRERRVPSMDQGYTLQLHHIAHLACANAHASVSPPNSLVFVLAPMCALSCRAHRRGSIRLRCGSKILRRDHPSRRPCVFYARQCWTCR